MHLRKLVLNIGLFLSIFLLDNTVSASTCGNQILELGEECEGNDGIKCIDCVIQAGYMCQNAQRLGLVGIGVQANFVQNALNPSQRDFVANEQPEQCMVTSIGRTEQFQVQDESGNIFFYAVETCHQFVAPTFYAYNNSCTFSPINECVLGLSDCDENAYCEEPENKIGFTCKCDKNFFAGKAAGKGCRESRDAMILYCTGILNVDSANTELNLATMIQPR